MMTLPAMIQRVECGTLPLSAKAVNSEKGQSDERIEISALRSGDRLAQWRAVDEQGRLDEDDSRHRHHDREPRQGKRPIVGSTLLAKLKLIGVPQRQGTDDHQSDRRVDVVRDEGSGKANREDEAGQPTCLPHALEECAREDPGIAERVVEDEFDLFVRIQTVDVAESSRDV